MRRTLFLLLFVFLVTRIFSQIQVDDKSGPSLKERGFLGLGIGGLGLGSNAYGSYYSIGLTPQAGYMFNQYFSSGLAFEYQYTGYTSRIQGTQTQNVSRYGWYPFVRLNIKKIFAQADYDWYSVAVSGGPKERAIFNRFLIGVGYFQQGRGRGGMNFLVSYDMLYSANGPFNSPLSIRIFFTF
jgi:hypothetical protein